LVLLLLKEVIGIKSYWRKIEYNKVCKSKTKKEDHRQLRKMECKEKRLSKIDFAKLKNQL